MKKIKHLHDIYKFTNFVSEASVSGIFGDPLALLIRLRRRQKKLFVASVVSAVANPMIRKAETFGTLGLVIGVFIYGSTFVVCIVTGAMV